MIKLNNIGPVKLLHNHSTGHKSKIKVPDYNMITKTQLLPVILQKILSRKLLATHYTAG